MLNFVAICNGIGTTQGTSECGPETWSRNLIRVKNFDHNLDQGIGLDILIRIQYLDYDLDWDWNRDFDQV